MVVSYRPLVGIELGGRFHRKVSANEQRRRLAIYASENHSMGQVTGDAISPFTHDKAKSSNPATDYYPVRCPSCGHGDLSELLPWLNLLSGGVEPPWM